MVAGVAKTLLKKGIVSLISQGKKIRKKAVETPLTKDYRFRRKKIERKKPHKYKTMIGEEKYNKFLKDFSKQYKTLGREDFQDLKKQMADISPDFWLRTQQNALNKGFINRADTKKVAMRAGSELSTKVPSPLAQGQIKLKGDRREAISSVYQDIASEAPTNKAGLPVLAKNAFGTKALFPRLKQQFPELFEGMEYNISGRRTLRRIVDKSPGKTELAPFPTKLQKPDFVSLSDTVNPTEVYFKKNLRRYTGEEVSREGNQYFVDQWRSRGPEFRTGKDALDVKKFLEFERRMGTLNPGNPYYYKNNPEFKAYEAMRKIQEPGMDLAHDRPTLNPLALYPGKRVPTETVPGSGADIGFTHFLERDVHRRLQPFYEDKAYKAMLANRYDELAAIDAEMIKRNIRTRIIDPNTGEERLMGGWKEFGFNKGGAVDRFQAGGLASLLGKKLLKKLAKKLSEKEMKILLGSLWQGIDPRKSGSYRVWDKKRFGPGYKWPYKRSRIRGPGPKEKHFSALTAPERTELVNKNRERLKKYWEAYYPHVDPKNKAFIRMEPDVGHGRYQIRAEYDSKGKVRYATYDLWDDAKNMWRKEPKFVHRKDAEGKIILKEVK